VNGGIEKSTQLGAP